jgi:hypothetical protein
MIYIKIPKANFERYSRVFLLIGLVLALLISELALNSQTKIKESGDVGSYYGNLNNIETHATEISILPNTIQTLIF